ncbi:molecular chaperone [Erythrobacter vulgaris]|uniref:Molecular chaperone n=1 Tax=Qipengyuania vulgaris TaxID=291985 RepID=A0A844XV93_9SPHN|nr:molecular chaperone [Qipengyuania vulgaris]MXO49424.1 molecular chaperone [Qipengyuania vulgaris]
MAMRVSPMVSELTTSGSGAAARIEVGNVSSTSLPFETRITRIEFDQDGKLIEVPADEDFLVFPPQGLVPSSGRQIVRVQWVGRPDIPTSQAYYVWIKQLPVETDPTVISGSEATVDINVLYTMKSMVVVAPAGAKPDVQIVSLEPKMIAPPQSEFETTPAEGVTEPEAVPGIKVVVSNNGTRYAMMSGATWTLTGTGVDGQPYERLYDHEEVSRILGVGYLPPAGGTRTFEIPTGVAIDPAKPIDLRFSR